MYQRLLVLISKILIKFLRLTGRSGSALPGLIIERLNPDFLHRSLNHYQEKIILVTGTNGKTTTTKMLVAALRAAGKRVVTNSTGSNMTRGLIAAIVDDMTLWGTMKQTDWFVFEMDEAYAPVFTRSLNVNTVVALNVLRDQLDRYGELDHTASLIGGAARKSTRFIYNINDPLLYKIAKNTTNNQKLVSFGVKEELKAYIFNEQTLHGNNSTHAHDQKTYFPDVSLLDVEEDGDGLKTEINANGVKRTIKIPLKGFHNSINLTAVIATVAELCNGQDVDDALAGISRMPVPFGRGEMLHMRDKNITVALVKNPSGFTNNLETFVKRDHPDAVLFMVNDNLADGRDVSWLWDVDFKSHLSHNTTLFTSGIRAYDMALRLKHDGLEAKVLKSPAKALDALIKGDYKNIAIIPTYTALFEIRQELSRYGKVPRIW